MKRVVTFLVLYLLFIGKASFAGEADVVNVEIKKSSENRYRFSVTVLHEDTGWDHFADRWDIIDEDGTVLGTRTLLHPHEEEQPFTRSLSGVAIPGNIKTVTVRAHDSVHEYGGKVLSLDLSDE